MSKSLKKLSQKSYTAEFKEDALKLVTEQGYSLSEAAKRLGIALSTMSKWRKALITRGHRSEAFPGKGHLRPSEAEFKELQKEVEKLRRERDILKKAMAYFTNPQV